MTTSRAARPPPSLEHNMSRTLSRHVGRRLATVAASLVLAGRADRAPVAPDIRAEASARAEVVMPADQSGALAALRRATDRYHRLDAAIADGFVFLHGCEVRPEGGPVGIVYVQPGRLVDGVIDTALPDGLIYAPSATEGPRLVAVELAVPFTQWTSPQAPTFLGATFQREDEFGVFGLHVWLWRNNPGGLFAESNPNVTCSQE
jgi:hypothetical protein